MKPKLNYSIALCGFMGSGKTSVGLRLADLLNLKFFDLDHYIENKYKTTVKDIFKFKGEKYFRKIEADCAVTLSKIKGAVISTGGGTFMNKITVEIFKQNGVKIFFLDASLKVINTRLKEDNTRPLILKYNDLKQIEELYNQRRLVYIKQADITIKVDRSIDSICKEIQEKLER